MSGPVQLSENALRVLEARYLQRDRSHRVVESPQQLFERVADAVALGEGLMNKAREGLRGRRKALAPARSACSRFWMR